MRSARKHDASNATTPLFRLDLEFDSIAALEDDGRLELGGGGAFVRSVRAPPEGARVILQVHLPDRGFLLTGQVVRVVHQGEHPGFGVQFTGSSAGEVADLQTWVDTRRHTDGTPELRAATFTGRLEQLGLAPMIGMLELERKTGVVEVTNAVDERVGTLYVLEGRIIDAAIDGIQSSPPEGSVFEMMFWKHGHFSYNATAVDRKAVITVSSTTLLMEGARRYDER